MLTNEDLARVMNSHQVKRIDKASKACKNAESDWAKNFWFNVWKTLCQKYGRYDLYLKDLH